MNKIKIGILQIHPHTLWRKGGGEIHARKHVQYGNTPEFETEFFNFSTPDKYDIIHYFGHSYQMNDIGKFARQEGIKVIGTPILYPATRIARYKWFLQFGRKLPFPTTLNLRQYLLQESDVLIANSQPEAEYLNKAYGIEEEKIKTIGTGVDRSYLSFAPDKKYLPDPVHKMDRYFLMTGRITPLKNQLEVVRLFKKLRLNLVLLGRADSDYPNYINDLRKEIEQTENIIWIEDILPDSNELKACYAFARAHILWSTTEVAALVNMEALSLGCLCICRNLPTTYDIMKENAFYAHDLKELEHQILNVKNITPGEKEERRIKGVNEIKQHRTWEHLVSETCKLYKNIL